MINIKYAYFQSAIENADLFSVLVHSSAFLIAHTHVKLCLAVTLLRCSFKTNKSFLVVPTFSVFQACGQSVCFIQLKALSEN